MKRMIKASTSNDEKLLDAACEILDMLAQTYENYGSEYSDDDMYDIVNEHIDDFSPYAKKLWSPLWIYLRSKYSFEDFLDMAPSKLVNIISSVLDVSKF